VQLKKAVNTVLARTTGYRLERATAGGDAGRGSRWRLRPGDRLLEAPVFVLSSLRSGSTLLSAILDAHSQMHSPHEMHLRHMTVSVPEGNLEKAMREVGLDTERLRFLLWDRVLHRELTESGKRVLVNKTPSDVFIADEIARCWPDARFLFLLRHPAAIARSRQDYRPQDSIAENASVVRRYAEALEKARTTHPGYTVRYEDLTTEPERVTRELCAYLGVPWEPGMLEYGETGRRRYKKGLGDWSEKIKSGRIQPAAPLPSDDDIPKTLWPIAVAWGYATDAAVPDPSPQG
jgi:Sulfotransferase family